MWREGVQPLLTGVQLWNSGILFRGVLFVFIQAGVGGNMGLLGIGMGQFWMDQAFWTYSNMVHPG